MRPLILILAVVIVGCSPCDDIDCVNGSKEKKGTNSCECKCEKWHEGQDCDKRVSNKFTGYWKGEGPCDDGSTGSLESRISNVDGKPKRITFENQMYGVLISDNEFNLPSQQMPSENGTVTISGGGELKNDDLIELTFIVSNQNKGGTCIIDLKKQ